MSARHGTAVSRAGIGVLILGQAGAGKSRLGLELMAFGAELVADDGVLLEKTDEAITLSSPATIKGIIEARGVGLLSVTPIEHAKLAIVVDMDKTAEGRLPTAKTISILGSEFPLVYGKNCPGLAAVIWCLLGGGQILSVD